MSSCYLWYLFSLPIIAKGRGVYFFLMIAHWSTSQNKLQILLKIYLKHENIYFLIIAWQRQNQLHSQVSSKTPFDWWNPKLYIEMSRIVLWQLVFSILSFEFDYVSFSFFVSLFSLSVFVLSVVILKILCLAVWEVLGVQV